MRARWLISGSLLVALIAVLAWAVANRTPDTQRGLIRLSVDGQSRRAIVFAPADRKQGVELPLVLAFHGTGQSAEAMAESSGLRSWAASGRAVVVFAEARRGMWMTVGVGSEEFPETNDTRFVRELIDQLATEDGVNPARIYAVGMSNGATFAEMLGLTMPDRFAAVAGFAGGLPGKYAVAKANRPLPVLLLVGDRDEHGAETTVRATAEQLTAAGHDVTLQILPGRGHRWDRSVNDTIWSFIDQNVLPQGDDHHLRRDQGRSAAGGVRSGRDRAGLDADGVRSPARVD
jgi:poly(3-hydroxybutyrate) depolymerase